jgi:Gram-negative bacterial TonB protein C-terminal
MRSSTSSTLRTSYKLLILFGLSTNIALAQVVPPMPQDQAEPQAPTNRFGIPEQGWVVARYTVQADGTTSEVRVIDKMPAALSTETVEDAIASWRFAPATSDGTPIAWYNNEAAILFEPPTMPARPGGAAPPASEGTTGTAGRRQAIGTGRSLDSGSRGGSRGGPPAAPGQPSPAFVAGYREVEEMRAAGELEDALKRSDELVNREANRLSEMSVGLVQNARVHLEAGDLHEAYAAITRVTNPNLPVLAPTELPVALQYRNTIELGLGDVVGALETYRRRQAAGPVPDSDIMAANAEAIEERLQSTDVAIGVKGKILDETWSHTPLRRTFAVGDVEGDLDKLRFECDRREGELEFSDQSEYTLPENFGECLVTLEGRRGAEFTFYEFE